MLTITGPVALTEKEIIPVPTATILATLPSGSPPAGGRSVLTIVETTSTGTTVSPNTITITSPATTATFTAGLGSTLNVTQVDTAPGQAASAPFTTPPFLVINPTPTPTPSGPVTLTVQSVA